MPLHFPFPQPSLIPLQAPYSKHYTRMQDLTDRAVSANWRIEGQHVSSPRLSFGYEFSRRCLQGGEEKRGAECSRREREMSEARCKGGGIYRVQSAGALLLFLDAGCALGGGRWSLGWDHVALGLQVSRRGRQGSLTSYSDKEDVALVLW